MVRPPLGPFVIGTAGHVDHGKTRLVLGLTGENTDRLEEERRRGVSIELGFAPWSTPAFEASIVDVPGHEDFIRTMVTGAGGLDILLLVVAADEGVMPQTREHAHICSVLCVRRAIVVLTKTDCLEDDESLELVFDDVRTELASTIFKDAPVVATAIPPEGPPRGLDELERLVTEMVRTLEPRSDDGQAVLSVDRAFSVRGRGTVVTATLLAGRLGVGDKLRHLSVDPHRAESLATVRGLQVRGSPCETVPAGERVAVNLAELELASIRRGDALSSGRRAMRSDALLISAHHLPHGPSPWRTDTAVLLCAGASRALARLDPLDPPALPPGGTGLVRVRLDRPIAIWRGLSVVFRQLEDSAAVLRFGRTIGGGTVIDPQPQAGRGLRPRWIALGTALQGDSVDARVLALIEDAGLRPIDGETLDRRCADLGTPSLTPKAIAAIDGVIPASGGFVGVGAVDQLQRQVIAEVMQSPGIAAPAIGVADQTATPALVSLALSRAVESGLLERDPAADRVYPPGRRPLTRSALPPRLETIVAAHEDAGLTPPTFKELAAAVDASVADVRTSIGRLTQAGILIRLSGDLALSATHHSRLLQRVEAHFTKQPRLDLQQFKTMTGVSRKFAVPMLEHLDEVGATLRRRGEDHVRSRGPKLDSLANASRPA